MILSKTKAALYSSLSSKKMRQRHGLFVVEGEKCVFDTLGAFKLERIVATSEWLKSHPVIEGVADIMIDETSESDMKKISSLSTFPEVIAVFHLPEATEEDLKLPGDSLSLLLDGIQDPGNLGTIIRTADWFGFDTIYASKDTVDVFNPKTIQATMGSLKRVTVKYVDLVKLIENSDLQNIYGTLLDGDDMYAVDLENKGAIIMGNEGKGLSDKVRELVNRPLLIPPYRKDSHGESLNVGVATAITLARFRYGK